MLISHPATVAVVRPRSVRPSVQPKPTPDLTTSVGRSTWKSGHVCTFNFNKPARSFARSFGCPLLMMKLTSGKTHVGDVADVHTGISVRRTGGLLIDPAHPNDAPERRSPHIIMFELSLSRGGGDDDLVSLHDFH